MLPNRLSMATRRTSWGRNLSTPARTVSTSGLSATIVSHPSPPPARAVFVQCTVLALSARCDDTLGAAIGCKNMHQPASECPGIQCCADNVGLAYAWNLYLCVQSRPCDIVASVSLRLIIHTQQPPGQPQSEFHTPATSKSVNHSNNQSFLAYSHQCLC